MARIEDRTRRGPIEPTSAPLVTPSPAERGRTDNAHGPPRGGHCLADIPIHDMGPAQRIESGVASRMGAAFGDDFSEVQVHTGPQAGRFVAQHQAVAATIGSHVAFAPGTYRPGTAVGDALLAHELAHVQQQRGSTASATSSTTHEDDAHQATAAVVSRLALGSKSPVRPRANARSAGLSVQGCRPSWAPEMPQGTTAPSNTRAFMTGAAIEQALVNSPTLGPYLATRINTGVSRCGGSPQPERVEGNVLFHPDADWEQAYMSYAAGKTNPDVDRCDSSFTEAEARARASRSVGFRLGDEMHINEDTAHLTAPLHEAIHRYRHDDYLPAVGYWANEGTTEYFTQVVLAEQGVVAGESYVDALASIRRMVNHSSVTDQVLADAYFNGNIDGLREAVDDGSPGRFAEWLGYMDRPTPDYAAADALF